YARRAAPAPERPPHRAPLKLPDPPPNLVRRSARAGKRRPGKDEDEPPPAIPAGDVAGAADAPEQAPQGREHRVSGLVTEAVVEVLESVDVQHDDGGRSLLALRSPDLSFEGLLHVAAVEEGREGLTGRRRPGRPGESEVRDG